MSTVTVTEVQYCDFLPFILWFRKEKKKSVRGSGEDLLVQYSTVLYVQYYCFQGAQEYY
jgi:hypothetical protein